MKFSIIIPVYNIERFLEECVDSVLEQDFNDYQIILVDDGSTDKSGTICDSYAETYEQITVIHKENSGLSKARNTGLLEATGDYIIFLDGDDYWQFSDSLSNINRIIDSEESDIVLFFMAKLYPGDVLKRNENKILIRKDDSAEQRIQKLICNSMLSNSACDKVYKRSMLIKNNLYFKEGIKSEDIEFNARVYSIMPSITVYNKDLYVYRQTRKDSISHSVDLAHCKDMLNTFEDSLKLINKSNECLLSFFSFQYLLLLGNAFRLPNSVEKKRLIDNIIKYKWIMEKSIDPIVKKAYFFERIVGIHGLGVLLSVYIGMRTR